MSKLYIKPYNDNCVLVQRGVITAPMQATRLDIAYRVLQSITREGVNNIRSIEVTDKANCLFYAFDNRGDHLVQTDGEGSAKFIDSIFEFTRLKQHGASTMTDTNAVNQEAELKAQEKAAAAEAKKAEREAAKAAKEQEAANKKAEREAAKQAKQAEIAAKKEAAEKAKAEKLEAAAAKKAAREQAKADKLAAAEAAKAAKGPSKKQVVLDMIANGGTTVQAIAEHLSISETAARSLIGDVKAGGHDVVSTRDKDTKISTFTLGAPASTQPEDAPESDEDGGEGEE